MDVATRTQVDSVTKYADMMSAMGTEPRLRIMRLLLSAHPGGLVVSEIGEELGIPGSTLSHHLEKLKHEDLVRVAREGTFLRVLGQRGDAEGTAGVPLCRVLLPEQGRGARLRHPALHGVLAPLRTPGATGTSGQTCATRLDVAVRRA